MVYKHTSDDITINNKYQKCNQKTYKRNIEQTDNTIKFSYDDYNPDITFKRLYYGKIYRLYIKVNNIYVRDMYPCKRLSDNICGLYDIIENKFYKSTTSYNYIGS